MNKAAFDASAIMAIYHNEPGRKRVLQLMDRNEAMISAINLAEVSSKLLESELAEDDFLESFEGLGIAVIDFDKQQAIETAKLRSITKPLGLSLGDGACLALAVREKAVAVTADKQWANLTICPVEVIR